MPMTQFATTLSDYIRAGYPAIAVTTHEEERLLRDLQTLKDIGWSFASWSGVRGWRDPEGKAIPGHHGRRHRADGRARDPEAPEEDRGRLLRPPGALHHRAGHHPRHPRRAGDRQV